MRVSHNFHSPAADNAEAGAVQPSHWNDDHKVELPDTLAALEPLATSPDTIAYFTGPGAAGLANLTPFARTLLAMQLGADILAAIGGVPALSAALTGTPTAPTASPGTNTTQIATTEFVAAAVAALINAAPGALDTLKELADAIGDDANFAATMTTALAGKQPLATNLTALAGLTGAANKVPFFTALGAMALLTVGTAANNLVQLDGTGKLPAIDGSQLTGVLASIPVATQADQEAGSSVAAVTTPAHQQSHASAVKAWIKFAGDGSAINASYNVSSLTDNGVGDWTVNFTVPFSSANYGIATACIRNGAGTSLSVKASGQLAGSCRLEQFNPTSAVVQDNGGNFAMFIGDQ